jgi:hypothetical protein
MPAPQSPSSTAPPPGPQGSAQNCQTVWVEGHYQTRVMSDGRRFTAWIPARSEQFCQQ